MRVVREGELAARLLSLRERTRERQTDIAKAIGVERGTYNNWERGLCRPNREHLHKIALYFGVQSRWLEHGDKDLIDERIDRVMHLMRHLTRELEHIHRFIRSEKILEPITGGLTRRERRVNSQTLKQQEHGATANVSQDPSQGLPDRPDSEGDHGG